MSNGGASRNRSGHNAPQTGIGTFRGGRLRMGALAGAIIAVLLGTFGLAALAPSRLRGGRSKASGHAQQAAPASTAEPPPAPKPEPERRAARGAPAAARAAGAALVAVALAVSALAIWLALSRL